MFEDELICSVIGFCVSYVLRGRGAVCFATPFATPNNVDTFVFILFFLSCCTFIAQIIGPNKNNVLQR